MDNWDLALLAAAGYVGLMTAVRLMLRRRDQLWGEFCQHMEEERERKRKAAEMEAQQRSRRLLGSARESESPAAVAGPGR